MKKVILISVFLCSLVLSANLTVKAQEISSVIADSTNEVEKTYDITNYFPLDVGNIWEYDLMKEELIAAEGSERIISEESEKSILGAELINGKETVVFCEDGEGGAKFYFALSPEGVLCYKMSYGGEYYDLIISSTPIFYPNNLEIGRELTRSMPIKRYDINDNFIEEGIAEIKVKLEEEKNITVPAGTFENCIKISFMFMVGTSKDSLSMIQEIWFAPGIGIIKGHDLMDNIVYDYELKRATIKGIKLGENKINETAAVLEKGENVQSLIDNVSDKVNP